MEILEKLFGSQARVKIMRLFLFNPETPYDVEDVRYRTKISPEAIRKEAAVLLKMGMIKKKDYIVEIEERTGKNLKIKNKKVHGWIIDKDFPYFIPLRNFLISTVLLSTKEILDRLSKIGKVKLIVVAGVFIQDDDSRADILVVGDKIKQNAVEKAIGSIEAEIGAELNYVYFDTDDFNYRLGVYDKLVRDILDLPHKVVLDKIGLKKGSQ